MHLSLHLESLIWQDLSEQGEMANKEVNAFNSCLIRKNFICVDFSSEKYICSTEHMLMRHMKLTVPAEPN